MNQTKRAIFVVGMLGLIKKELLERLPLEATEQEFIEQSFQIISNKLYHIKERIKETAKV